MSINYLLTARARLLDKLHRDLAMKLRPFHTEKAAGKQVYKDFNYERLPVCTESKLHLPNRPVFVIGVLSSTTFFDLGFNR